jgi:hypothetical protein
MKSRRVIGRSSVIKLITLWRTGRMKLARQFKLVAVFLRIATLAAKETFTQK